MNKGFSLIELLVVLSIIGVLAAIAYPSYTHYMVRMRRLDGQTALLNLAQKLEQYHHQTHTFQTATLGQGKSSDVLTTPYSSEGWYTLHITYASKHDYQLQAAPRGVQATQDRACGTFTLTRNGVEGIIQERQDAPTLSSLECWS